MMVFKSNQGEERKNFNVKKILINIVPVQCNSPLTEICIKDSKALK